MTALFSPLPLILLLAGLYFGIRLRFFPFLHPVRVVRGLFARAGGAGGVSSFRAAGLALAGTIGVGNITGVALALIAGGAGAVFWMWVCATAAMLLKYAEITLSMDCRTPDGQGGFVGGTAHTMRAIGWRGAATAFALLCLGHVLTVGGLVQANAVADCLGDAFSFSPFSCGLILFAITLPVILGGGRKISAWTARLVPLMCLLYFFACGWVLFRYADRLPAAFSSIFREAFTPSAAGGGALGFLSARCVRVGAARGLMSNEGGCGTAPMAHVTSSETVPARQGLFGIFEVFADTIVICTLTAVTVLCAFPDLPEGLSGIGLVRAALASALGGAATPILSLSLFFFAYATILSAAFYGQTCLSYFGIGRRGRAVFAVLFSSVLLAGAVSTPAFAWSLSDLLLSSLTCFNLALLLKKADRVVALTAEGGYLRSVCRGKRPPARDQIKYPPPAGEAERKAPPLRQRPRAASFPSRQDRRAGRP